MTIIDDAPRVMSPDAADDAVAFRDLGLPDVIVHRLESQGKHTAFPIQAAVIPDALAGRDGAGPAPTGRHWWNARYQIAAAISRNPTSSNQTSRRRRERVDLTTTSCIGRSRLKAEIWTIALRIVLAPPAYF